MAASETVVLQSELLKSLADTAPAEYLQLHTSGQSVLRTLYAQAAEAGLVPGSPADDVARLHCLFDVALDHGLGCTVRDYIVEVCSDRTRTSSDPLEAFLLDGECVRRWVQKLLAVIRGRLSAWLSRGVGAAGSAGVLSRELGRLHMLQLVAEALQPRGQTPGDGAAAPAQPAEAAEAARLAVCARVLAWLAAQRLAFDRASGRHFSEQEWRSVAAKRREGGAAAGLFLSDLLADLAGQGVSGLAYPPPSPDRLLSALFLAPGGSDGRCGGGVDAAVRPKLALLAYYLADGGFLGTEAMLRGLRAHFGVPHAAAAAWLLQQQLDDAQAGGAAGAAALQRAAELAPATHGGELPHRVLQSFVALGRPDVALRLLRQRGDGGGGGSLAEAAAALQVRFHSGLLPDAFLGLKHHLAATPAGERAEHAAALTAQLLRYAAGTRGAGGMTMVHSVLRLPFDAVEEEAVLGWLEGQAGGGRLEAALLLPLYFLLRGRTAEALHAYSRHCPRVPTTQQQADLAQLLAEAARMLPVQQRSLVVACGGAPALAPLGGAEEAGAGVALLDGLPDVAADGAPAMLAVGPSAAEAPLVGSVPLLLERHRLAASEAAAGGGGGGRNGGACTAAEVPPPLLFGQRQQAGAAAAGDFAAGVAGGEAGDGGGPLAAAVGGSAAHEFDRVLGLKGTPAGKGKRRWAGGSAYR